MLLFAAYQSSGRSPVLTALQRFDRKVAQAILRGFGLSVTTDTPNTNNTNTAVPSASVEALHPVAAAGASTGSETTNATTNNNIVAEGEATAAASAAAIASTTVAAAAGSIAPINDSTTATSD